MLLADKTIGHIIPVRFLIFSLIGGLGVLVHMAALIILLKGAALGFTIAQSVAAGSAMIFNFAVNNVLTLPRSALEELGMAKGSF